MQSKTWLSVLGGLFLGGVPEGRGAAPVAGEPEVPVACEPDLHFGDRDFAPLADTYVAESSPDTTHGSDTLLVVDGTPRQEVYLRFEVSEHTNVFGAWLSVPVVGGTSDAPILHATESDWNEHTLTWNTRPRLRGRPLANVGVVRSGDELKYDLRHVIGGPGVYSFALIPESEDGMEIHSRESGALKRPKLTLLMDGSTCTFRGYRKKWGPSWKYGAQGDEVAMAMATEPFYFPGATEAFVIAGAYGPGGRLGSVPFPGQRGLMLGRFRADGSHEWSRGFAQESAVMTVAEVAMTAGGRIVMGGSYTGTPDLGTGPLPSAAGSTIPAMFIAGFSTDGTTVWSKGFVATLEQGGVTRRVPVTARSVATDAQGSLFVTGSFHGTLNLGGGALEAGPLSRDPRKPTRGMFLARFSSEGTHLWSKAFPGLGGGFTQGARVATDRAGNVAVGGVASGDGENEKVLGARYAETPFIARFSPEGALYWARALDFARGEVLGLTTLWDGAVAFSGWFWPAFYFRSGAVLNHRRADDPLGRIPGGMLGVIESWGEDRWARAIGNGRHERALRLVGAGEYAIVVLGDFRGGADLGGGFISTGGNGFVATYDSGRGGHTWSRALPEGMEPTLLGLTWSGVVRVGGSFSGTVRLRDVTHSSSGGSDVMLLNLPYWP
ncbi:DUF7594 domain-containing protein [Myxococcus stipitatus]|uniref:CBM96 family carbohydrate-binding protein n=1 Tax=Myxococcus stipitatus TaxID=83455 RepID=UPI0030D53F36